MNTFNLHGLFGVVRLMATVHTAYMVPSVRPGTAI